MKVPSPATVIATLALIVATTGSAFAAGLIDGNTLKPNSVPASKLTEAARRGLHGNTGAPGKPGNKGDNGDTGSKGVNGSKGDSGTAGAIGSAGLNGLAGANGSNGSNGVNGTQGAAGSNGSNGAAGAPGAAGAEGAQGITGNTGAPGPQGAKGDTGAPGATGATGAVGATGAQGAKGDTGSPWPTVVPSGVTLKGMWQIQGLTPTTITFLVPLPSAPNWAAPGILVVAPPVTRTGTWNGAPYTWTFGETTALAHCHGSMADPTADPGYMCLYVPPVPLTLPCSSDPTPGICGGGGNAYGSNPYAIVGNSTKFGVTIRDGYGATWTGTWAVTAP